MEDTKVRFYLKRFFGNRSIINFNDMETTEPVSKVFGFDRGTPIDRYYIEKFYNENAEYIKDIVLEIADSNYSNKFGGKKVSQFEVLHLTSENKLATLIGDLTKPETIPHNKVNCFICVQTLNFIFDIREAILSSFKVLKNGGVFLGTVSGISQISRYDMDRWGDYWRFTNLSILKLFEETFGKGNVQVFTYGNVLSSVCFLKGLSLEDIPNKNFLDKHDPDYQIIIGIRAFKRI